MARDEINVSRRNKLSVPTRTKRRWVKRPSTVAADLATGPGMDRAIKYVFDTFKAPPEILINTVLPGYLVEDVTIRALDCTTS